MVMNYNKRNINILAFFISIVILITINVYMNYLIEKKADKDLTENDITELINNI